MASNRMQGPAFKLHDELLAEIFRYACREPISICIVRGPVWDLQLVCSRWRRVIKDTPSLWSAFEMKNMKDCRLKTSTIVRRVNTCLELSKAAPLSISFPDECTRQSVDATNVYLDVIRHADRWVSFTVDGYLLYDLVHDRVQGPLRRKLLKKRGLGKLRSLTIQYKNGEECCDADACPFGTFKTATALEEVKWFRMTCAPKPSHHFPWSSVKKFTMERCLCFGMDDEGFGMDDEDGEDHIIAMFKEMASLEVFVWANNHINDTPISKTKVVTLPSVHTIALQDTIDHRDRHLWSMLCMPRLTNVQIIEDVKQFKRFSSMVRMSASHVKRLQLESCSAAFFHDAIEVFPAVEELSLLEPVGKSSDILLKLIWDPVGIAEKILPSLQKLELRDLSPKNDGFLSSLMKVMRSRSKAAVAVIEQQSSNSIAPLFSVKCTVGDKLIDDPSVSQLKDLGNELGIVVEVEVTDALPVVHSSPDDDEYEYDSEDEDKKEPTDDEGPPVKRDIMGHVIWGGADVSDLEGVSDSEGGDSNADSEADLDSEGGGDSDAEGDSYDETSDA